MDHPPNVTTTAPVATVAARSVSGPIKEQNGLRHRDRPGGTTSTRDHQAPDDAAKTASISVESSEHVGWLSMPRKKELSVIFYGRLTESLAQTGFTSLMYHGLQSLDPSLSKDQVAVQGGITRSAFAICACCTAVIWGAMARSTRIGSAKINATGLFVACIGYISMAFATGFKMAVFASMLGGTASGNVGVTRAMVAELAGDE